MGKISFGENNITMISTMFIGNGLLIFIIMSFKLIIKLLFDFENNRFINYQISLLKPQLVLLEYITFTSFFTFFLSLPFYPISKLILGSYLDTTNTSWIQTIIILFLGSILLSTYHLFITCILKSSQHISQVWMRCTEPLLMFGGFWVPWYIMHEYSPKLGYFILINPFLYVTEGLRTAILPSSHFFSFGTCVVALIGFSCAFTLASMYAFKKRLDHI